MAEVEQQVREDIETVERLRREVEEMHRNDVEFGGGCVLVGVLLGVVMCVSCEEWLRRR